MSRGPKQTLQEGYEKFVLKKENDCWDWIGCISAGYGQFRFNMNRERAHRAAWILNYGEIPKDKQVLHTCDNRKCSNPEHLYLGTSADNNRDILERLRCIRGNDGRYISMGSTI